MRCFLVLMAVGCGSLPEAEVTLTPQSPTVETPIMAEVTLSEDLGDLTLQFAWAIDGEPVDSAVGDSLPVGGHAKGDTISLDVFVVDGDTRSAGFSATPVVVGNAAPVADSASISPSSATSTETLTAAAVGHDADDDSITFTYNWFVDGVAAGSGPTLAPPNPAGSEIIVEAVPNDGTIDGEPVRSASLVTTNAPPALPAPPVLTTVREYVPSALSCTLDEPVLDPDGDPVTYEMAWIIDGSTQAAKVVTERTLTADRSDTVSGGIWGCHVRALDDSGLATEWVAAADTSDQSCDEVTVTLDGKSSASLAYNNGTSWNDTTLRAYTYFDSSGNDDIVGWVTFLLSGHEAWRGVRSATLNLHSSGVSGGPEVVVIQSSAIAWDPNAPSVAGLPRDGAVSESMSDFTPGVRANFPIDLDAWAYGPNGTTAAVTLGVDNLKAEYSYAYFGSVKATSFAPKLILTVCD